MEVKSNFSFSLQEIADWTLKEKSVWNKPHAQIPSFQRGLVWNPAQIEVLWDSLMRGIPVGVFSLISAKASPEYGDVGSNEQLFWLLDGQQRANAITLGYQNFPPSDDKKSILWIDLLPDDEQRKRSNRKFFFYVTTPAQPWGYRINDANGENRSAKLSASERRTAMETLHIADAESQAPIVEKPIPAKLYPIAAKCPIPFALLKNYFLQGQPLLNFVMDNTELNETLKNKVKEFFETDASRISDMLEKLCQGMAIADKTTITALIAPEELSQATQNVEKNEDEAQRDSDIAVYFTRLNRGGTLPSNEDLNYSILKSIAPALAKIDTLAQNRMHPARLANLAMLCYISLKKQKWEGQIYRKTVYSLAQDGAFSSFVNGEFENALTELHRLLCYHNNENSLGLPPVLLTSIARNNQSLYLMLLLLVCMGKLQTVPVHFLIGFVTVVSWFNQGVDFSALYKMFIEEKTGRFEDIAKKWLFKMFQTGKLLPLPTVEAYQNICDAVNPDQNPTMERVYTAWNPTGYRNGLNRIWYWNQRESRELLLYVCRDYVSGAFGSYDPASMIWNEDSCPWDYDHIFPQNWIVSGQGNRQGTYHELVFEFFNCIGNIAPLHFSLNRGKSDEAPGVYFNLRDKLFIGRNEQNKGLFDEKPKSRIEYDETEMLPFQYVSVIAERLHVLYSKWYNSLNIGVLLDFSDMPDLRKILFQSLQKKYPKIQLYYVGEDGRQFPLVSQFDWARPSISCGIITDWLDDGNVKHSSLFCITSDGERYELGFRRHPEDTAINGNGNQWWYEYWGNPNYENAEEKFISLAKEKNILLDEV